MVQVYAFGHISGAHFNPAVTATFAFRGKMPIIKALLYVAVQLFGGATGAMTAYAVAGPGDLAPFAPAPDLPNPVASIFLAEFLYSFALCLVVSCVATAHADDPNSHYAICIGFTLLSTVSAVGPISGGVINPAVGTSVDLLSTAVGGVPKYTWVYWVAPLLASVLAAALYSGLERMAAAEQEAAADAEASGEDRSASLAFDLPLRVVVFEFVGTFFLALTAGLGSQPLAVGAILTAFIFSSAGFCGGDFNPAVTFGAMLRFGVTRSELWKTAIVMLAQTTAGILAGFAAFAVSDQVGWPHPDGAQGSYGAFVYEMMWTALLVTVVLNTTTPVFTPAAGSPPVEHLYRARSSVHGLAIGMTLTAGIIGANKHGSGSGGVFNPAVGTGLSLAALAREHDATGAVWMYWVAPLIGAAVASGVFRLLHVAGDEAEAGAGLLADGEGMGSAAADSMSAGLLQHPLDAGFVGAPSINGESEAGVGQGAAAAASAAGTETSRGP